MAITKLNNKAVANVTTLPVALGDMVLVSSATASSSASIEFSLGNYKEYKFFFVNMHPQTDNVRLSFQCSTDGGSNYNTTMTTTWFRAYHYENDTGAGLSYVPSLDQAQGTAYQVLDDIGADNDQCTTGILHLFNPASTTYVKHFICRTQCVSSADYSIDSYIAGYFNDTNDLTNISFKMTSGNIDAGKILMFGIN